MVGSDRETKTSRPSHHPLYISKIQNVQCQCPHRDNRPFNSRRQQPTSLPSPPDVIPSHDQTGRKHGSPSCAASYPPLEILVHIGSQTVSVTHPTGTGAQHHCTSIQSTLQLTIRSGTAILIVIPRISLCTGVGLPRFSRSVLTWGMELRQKLDQTGMVTAPKGEKWGKVGVIATSDRHLQLTICMYYSAR